MMHSCIHQNPYTGDKNVSYAATEALERNNTYVPGIERVIFSVKTEKKVPVLGEDGKPTGEKKTERMAHPVMATTVFFVDGTSVTVKNAESDEVETELETLSDGSKVEVASRRSKELAIAHAVMKRVIGTPDENGKVEGGYGRVLTRIVDSAYDQNRGRAEDLIKRAAAKKARAESKAQSEKASSKKKYTVDDLVRTLRPLVEKLAGTSGEGVA